jgi:hypothetical protein
MSTDLEALKQWATPRQCEIIDAISVHGTQKKAAAALGIHIRNVEKAIRRAKKNASKHGWSPDHDMIYPAPETHLVKGVSTLYGPTGMVKQQWVRTDLKKEQLTEALHQVAADLCETLPKYEPKPSHLELTTNALSAYVIGDAHIGAYVKAKNNHGAGDWDLDIAERVTLDAIHKLISSAGGTDIGMLVDVGDFLHTPTPENKTQSGHPLDVDGHFDDIIRSVVRIYRTAIEIMLCNHREVVLMMTRGNHNDMAALLINIMLQAVYENEPRVTILDNNNRFMTYMYGNNFFGSHHADRVKFEQMYQFFTRNMAKDWGNTEHRFCFCGHYHHSHSKEIGGMMFEIFNTMAAPDQWHSNSGYGAKRSMSAIIFDKDHGEVQRHKVVIGQVI